MEKLAIANRIGKNLYIFPRSVVVGITNGACIAHLLKSKVDNCTKIYDQHVKYKIKWIIFD